MQTIAEQTEHLIQEHIPIIAVAGKNDAWTWVGIAGDPSAVDSKEHKHHDEEDGDEGPHVGPYPILFLWLLLYFPDLPSL